MGSEMCIRDSPGGPPQCIDGTKPKLAAPSPDGRAAEISLPSGGRVTVNLPEEDCIVDVEEVNSRHVIVTIKNASKDDGAPGPLDPTLN